jgi:prepilin-type N-terminal cleavage/methylation domain-containing protein
LTLLPPHRRSGFTLLEVVIALAILSVSVMILVETQAGALLMSTDADRMQTATYLAEEKMMEAQLILEREGWGSQDIEEEGDFEDFGEEEFRGGSLQLDIESDQYDDYKWAYTIREINLDIPSNLGDMAGDLSEGGYFGERDTEEFSGSQPDLTDMGISPDMISEYLGAYIREVRVLVWWGDNEDEIDQVELLTHIINPSGAVTSEEDTTEDE